MSIRPGLVSRLVIASTVSLFAAASAYASYNHPATARELVVNFVRAMQPCTSGTHTYPAPLAFPACDPVSASPTLSFGPAGSGEAHFKVKPAVGPASDVNLVVRLSDVRVGDDGTGAPFEGILLLQGLLRISNHLCDGNGTPCTVIDLPLPASVPCGSAGGLPPGKCRTSTTLNAILAGSVPAGAQSNWEITQLQIYSGGDLVFEQGLYLP